MLWMHRYCPLIFGKGNLSECWMITEGAKNLMGSLSLSSASVAGLIPPADNSYLSVWFACFTCQSQGQGEGCSRKRQGGLSCFWSFLPAPITSSFSTENFSKIPLPVPHPHQIHSTWCSVVSLLKSKRLDIKFLTLQRSKQRCHGGGWILVMDGKLFKRKVIRSLARHLPTLTWIFTFVCPFTPARVMLRFLQLKKFRLNNSTSKAIVILSTKYSKHKLRKFVAGCMFVSLSWSFRRLCTRSTTTFLTLWANQTSCLYLDPSLITFLT